MKAQTLKLNLYNDDANTLESVNYKHLYLDETKGPEREPVLSSKKLSTAPGPINIGAEATIILNYKFATAISIDQTSVENKFMGARLASGTNAFGDQMFRATRIIYKYHCKQRSTTRYRRSNVMC